MYRTAIIGAGPGGTGPLIWAAQNDLLRDWLDDGLVLLDSGREIGGTIGRYIVNSDTSASVYLEFLESPHARALFGALIEDPAAWELKSLGDAYPPLSLVQVYLKKFGTLLEKVLANSPNSAFKPLTTARALRMNSAGRMIIETEAANGDRDQLVAEAVVMALGGWQNPDLIQNAELRPNVRLKDIDQAKIIPSDRFLTVAGLRDAARRLSEHDGGRVVILGGSHSAFSCAWALAEAMPEIDFAPGQVTMLLRRQPKIFYRSAEEAAADFYPFCETDICPRTKRVHRLGGLRSDGRVMWRRLSGRPGTILESRIRIVPLDRAMSAAQLRRILDDASLIIPAFGYRSRTIPLFDAEGRRVPFAADFGGVAVGQDARFLTQSGDSVPNLFGIGLGAGYRPWGTMGGEPGFDGQANSLWLYQHGIGEMVYRGIRNILDRTRMPAGVARSTMRRLDVDFATGPSLRTI